MSGGEPGGAGIHAARAACMSAPLMPGGPDADEDLAAARARVRMVLDADLLSRIVTARMGRSQAPAPGRGAARGAP